MVEVEYQKQNGINSLRRESSAIEMHSDMHKWLELVSQVQVKAVYNIETAISKNEARKLNMQRNCKYPKWSNNSIYKETAITNECEGQTAQKKAETTAQ